jgi:hypothetical protein
MIDGYNTMNEYSDLIKLVEASDSNREDVFSTLMQKETKVLDLLNRVAQQNQEKKATTRVFYNMSLIDLMNSLLSTWRIIIREVTHEDQTANTVKAIFWDGDRKLYVGVSVVMIGLILFFIDISK